MSKETIVMITPHGDPLGRIGEPDVGGQCVYIRELSVALAAQGARVLAFTRDRSDGRPGREQIAPGADVIRIQCGPSGFLPKEQILPHLEEFAVALSTYLSGDEIISSHFWDGGHVASLLREPAKWVHTSHSLGKRKLASLPDADPGQYKDRIAIETRILRCDYFLNRTRRAGSCRSLRGGRSQDHRHSARSGCRVLPSTEQQGITQEGVGTLGRSGRILAGTARSPQGVRSLPARGGPGEERIEPRKPCPVRPKCRNERRRRA